MGSANHCPIQVDIQHVPRVTSTQQRLSRPLANRREHLPVERQHRDARDVEGAHRWKDEEIGVVERADVRSSKALVYQTHKYNIGPGGHWFAEPIGTALNLKGTGLPNP